MKYFCRVTSLFNGSNREISNIVADGFIDNQRSRFFLLEDLTRIEISVENVIFEFSPDRAKSIEQVRHAQEQNKVIGKIGG